jgi:diguanylate cyclase
VNGTAPKIGQAADSLSRVQATSEHARALVEECAGELSSVTTAIRLALAERDAKLGIESLLEKTVAIEEKVHAASDELTVVNQALKVEIRDRNLIDHQFAAAEEQERASRHAAFHDALTGLPNRVLFNDRLEHGFAEAKRHGWTLAVLFVDLDRFKLLNDSHGHAAGDGVLKAVARRLQENTRGEDTVSRHGGDEFLCLLMEVRDEKSVAKIAAKIIQAIQAPCSVSLGDTTIEVRIRASIGISIFPKDGSAADTLVKKADEAMYMAKQAQSGYAFAI